MNNAGTNPRAAGFEAAGQRPSSNFWDITPAAWNRVVAVNFTGAFLMVRAVAGHMLAQGWGRIIGVTTSMDTMYRKAAPPTARPRPAMRLIVALMAQELEGTG